MAQRQQYTFEVNQSIGGSDFVPLDAIDSKFPLSKKKVDNEIFGRFQDFNIECYDAGFELLQTIAAGKQQTELKVYLNTILQVNGVIELLGFQDENRELNKVKVKVDDEYKLLLEDIDREFNYFDGDLDIWTIQADTNIERLTIQTTAFTDPAPVVGSVWWNANLQFGGGPPVLRTYYARQEKRVKDFIADELIGTDGWVLLTDHGDDTKTIVRDWTPYYPVAVTGDFVFNIGLITDPPPGFAFIEFHVLLGNVFLDETAYYNLDPSETYTRARKLFDIIEYLVGEIDGTIVFDNTETSTDSFFYFKDYSNPDAQDSLTELMVTQITDFILNDAGDEKDEPATIANITFEKVLNFIKNRFYVWWELEDRSGTFYFVFKHWTERSFSSGIDFADFSYFGTNWSAGKEQYEYEQNKLWKFRKRQELSSNVDFVGLDLELLDVNSEVVRDVQFGTFFTDIWDIQNNPSKYPDNSINQFVLAATKRESQGNDLITGITNSVTSPYETFSFAAGVLTCINSSGSGLCTSDPISFERGDALVFTFDLIDNGGQIPTLSFDGVNYFPIVGSNVIYTKPVRNNQSRPFSFSNGAGADWVIGSVTILEAKKYFYNVLKSTGAISGESVANVTVGIGNTDAEHLAKIPLSEINVNGSDISLAANKLEKIKKIIPVAAPVINFADFDFFETINTDLGAAEIESISLPGANKLAKFELIF